MTRGRLAAGLGAGLCLALAMPPRGVAPLGLGTFALLALALHRASPRDACLSLWLGGTAAFALTGPWLVGTIARFTGAPTALSVAAFILACVWMGSAWALFGYLAARAAPHLGAPLAAGLSAWVALRYGPRLFPYPLALPLVDLPALPQCADLVGVDGLGAALLGGAVLCVEDLAVRRARGALALAAALLVAGGYGARRSRGVAAARERAERWRVALAQPAMGASLRWEDGLRVAASRRLEALYGAAHEGPLPDLVVWPEAAHPWELTFEAGRTPGADEPLPRVFERAPLDRGPPRAPLLFGVMARPRDPSDPRRFNAAMLLDAPRGSRRPRVVGVVAKRVLVPFGEYLPLVAASPSLHARLTRREGVSPGPAPQRMWLGDREIGVLNCFEDTVPEAGAELAGVDLVVNLTNDAWFDAVSNAQHVLAARWRAIELRRDLVRASNEGASGHIDALGREALRAPQGVMGVWSATPRLIRGVRSAAPWVMVWGPRAALVALVAALWQARRRESER